MKRDVSTKEPVRRGLAAHVLASIGRDMLYGPWYDALFWLALPATLTLAVVTSLWSGAPGALEAAEGVTGWLVTISMIGWFGAKAHRRFRAWRAEAHRRRLELARAHGEAGWAGYEQQVVGRLNAFAAIKAELHAEGASPEAIAAVDRAYDQTVAEYKQRSEARSDA